MVSVHHYQTGFPVFHKPEHFNKMDIISAYLLGFGVVVVPGYFLLRAFRL